MVDFFWIIFGCKKFPNHYENCQTPQSETKPGSKFHFQIITWGGGAFWQLCPVQWVCLLYLCLFMELQCICEYICEYRVINPCSDNLLSVKNKENMITYIRRDTIAENSERTGAFTNKLRWTFANGHFQLHPWGSLGDTCEPICTGHQQQFPKVFVQVLPAEWKAATEYSVQSLGSDVRVSLRGGAASKTDTNMSYHASLKTEWRFSFSFQNLCTFVQNQEHDVLWAQYACRTICLCLQSRIIHMCDWKSWHPSCYLPLRWLASVAAKRKHDSEGPGDWMGIRYVPVGWFNNSI